MSYNYGPLASKAVALIAKYGANVPLFLLNDLDTPADAARPWRGPAQADNLNYNPKGLITTWSDDRINGDLIRSTDQLLLIAGQDPAILQMISDGHAMEDVSYAITPAGRLSTMNISPVQPGDTLMLYTIRLRQG